MERGYGHWPGVFAPVGPEMGEPSTAVTVQGLGRQGKQWKVDRKPCCAGGANVPAGPLQASVPNPGTEAKAFARLQAIGAPPGTPRNRSPLATAACTCGIAPQAQCSACARWLRYYEMVQARMAARRGETA